MLHAHSQGAGGIVHRDIKPANIMINERGNTKLTDFGVPGPPQTKDMNIEGTPYFLAPEVISGEMVDGRADIYALGVTAFYRLTNRFPFAASSIDELKARQLQDTLPDIRKYSTEIDSDLASFVSESLASESDERLQDWKKSKACSAPEPGITRLSWKRAKPPYRFDFPVLAEYGRKNLFAPLNDI